MSGTEDAPDRAHLEGVVERARTELRDWTDTTEPDPSVALMELFALLVELVGSPSERLAAESHLGVQGRRPPPHDSIGVRRESVLHG